MDIDKLRELADIHADIDYGDLYSVKRGNTAADEIRSEIRKLAGSGRVEELMSHLSESALGPWLAYTIAELPSISESQRNKCVARIKEIALGGGLESTAAKLWLNKGGNAS